MKCAHGIGERVCNNAEAADLSDGSERYATREQGAYVARRTIAYIGCPPEIRAMVLRVVGDI